MAPTRTRGRATIVVLAALFGPIILLVILAGALNSALFLYLAIGWFLILCAWGWASSMRDASRVGTRR